MDSNGNPLVIAIHVYWISFLFVLRMRNRLATTYFVAVAKDMALASMMPSVLQAVSNQSVNWANGSRAAR